MTHMKTFQKFNFGHVQNLEFHFCNTNPNNAIIILKNMCACVCTCVGCSYKS